MPPRFTREIGPTISSKIQFCYLTFSARDTYHASEPQATSSHIGYWLISPVCRLQF